MIATLIQFVVSLIAVAGLVGLSAWLGRPRPTPALDEAAARRIRAEEFPDDAPDAVWPSADGRGALARSGDRALVIYRLGDGYVARALPWREALAAPVRDGRLDLRFAEVAAPRARLAMGPAWPPREAAAA